MGYDLLPIRVVCVPTLTSRLLALDSRGLGITVSAGMIEYLMDHPEK